MTELPKKPLPPSVWVWILVTLLWGTVFYVTSTWMLGFAAHLLGEGVFDTGSSEALTVYFIYVPVLIAIALVSMTIKNLIDPGSLKQIQRHQAVAKGTREQYFVSFAGSIATSFIFTVITALMHAVSTPLTGAVVVLPAKTVVVAAGLNIGAGLAASLLVGIIFMVTRAVRGAGKG
ncbi:MAG: hypothetical protein HGA60_09850 [Chlorobiaceae bacterium]|nr:hypothetical protein [Chlorobiaceae bacterium]